MPLVEVQPKADITPGTYEGVVSSVEKDTIVPRTGRNAGQNVPILRWNFIIDGVDESVESITGRDPSSEKSNLFKYFVALLGPNRTAWLSAEVEDLVGKKALVTVSVTDDGWPRVDGVTAMPTKRAQPVSVPAAAKPASITVADDEDLAGDLPF